MTISNEIKTRVEGLFLNGNFSFDDFRAEINGCQINIKGKRGSSFLFYKEGVIRDISLAKIPSMIPQVQRTVIIAKTKKSNNTNDILFIMELFGDLVFDIIN